MDHLDLDLRELNQVLAIAAEGSFAQAARRLHISQPALSRSIQEVERKIGLRLFERGRGGATPTDVGRMVLRHAETVTAAAWDLQRELALIRGLDTGALRIGTGVFPPELFLGQALGQLARHGKGICLRMVGGAAPDLLKLLRKREIDLLVADPYWLEKTSDVSVIAVSSHQAHLIVRAGHPLVERSRVTLEEATRYPLVTSSAVPPRIARFATRGQSGQARMQAAMGRWVPTIYTDSIAMMKDTVRMSDAVTMLSLYLVRHELDRGELKVLPVSLPWIKARFAFMHLSHRTLSPLAEALIQAATAAASAVQEEEKLLSERWVGTRARRSISRTPERGGRLSSR
jgi:DNA-binding transcriptional LysR family regulator